MGQPLLDLLIRQVVLHLKRSGLRLCQLVQVPNQRPPMTRGVMHRNLLHRHPLRPVLKLQLIILWSKNLGTLARPNLQWRGDCLVFIISNRMLTFKNLSIPRPEVVKRVRPETKAAGSPKGSGEGPIPSKSDSVPLNDRKAALVILPSGSRDETSGSYFQQNGPPGKDHGDSSRLYNPQDQTHPRGDTSPVMPPPVVPSQTASAQELRETARQSMGRTERSETRSQNGSATHSPRVRSPSPSSRPGTRNPSNESRTSGGKSRSDPGNADRSSDDHRAEREGRTENRETTGVSRRDSLTHTRTERSGRDREKDRDGDRDKDRGRDRHGERDREKDRDRDRDRERDRERERERDRDRDRHRRDDKDRDRETRKEREALTIRGQSSPAVPVVPVDDRGLPIRPDIPRHRNPPQNGDDSLGKRRRPADDDVGSMMMLFF